MPQVRTSRFHQRIGITALACALAAPALAHDAGDPQKLLAEGDRLAWLRVSEPLYDQAHLALVATGDSRSALYAEVGRLRGQLAKLAGPEVSDRLAGYLEDPIVAGDERLRLRVLSSKPRLTKTSIPPCGNAQGLGSSRLREAG